MKRFFEISSRIVRTEFRALRYFLSIASLAALIQSSASGASPDHAPEMMTRLAVRLQSADIPEDSFAAKPKTMYRAGNRYCRIDELPDPEHGIYGLIIINEPDVWMVNLIGRTAQHIVDSGPTFNCRLPIFQPESADDMKNPVFQLEFGQELAYFKEKGALPKQGPVLRGRQTRAYSAEVAGSQLYLFTAQPAGQPVAVVRQQGEKRETYWYGAYEQIPFDSKLFAKPEGVRIEESKQ